VGSSGSGKTATAGKLAFTYASLLRKKVHWVSADTVRTGAIAETRAFTDALGIPMHLIYTPEDFTHSAPAWEGADLVLVDTPGLNPCCEAQMVQLGALLTEIPQRCTYLVASATTKESDLAQAASSMGLYSLQGVIFTRLDETYTYGSVYNTVRSSLLPMAFFASGKAADANLAFADAARLVDALMGKGWSG
jgi:flagellar biosynthesis protein FlhF